MASLSSHNWGLTANRVRELFDYFPETGQLVAKIEAPHRPIGHIVTERSKTFRIDGHHHVVARVVWLHFYGEWPKSLVDHHDRNDRNNRINNLRDATYRENQYNKGQYNPHGYKGVTWRNRIGKPWLSKIRVNGKRINLGSFGTKEEAAEAYRLACIKYHGEFACLTVGAPPPTMTAQEMRDLFK